MEAAVSGSATSAKKTQFIVKRIDHLSPGILSHFATSSLDPIWGRFPTCPAPQAQAGSRSQPICAIQLTENIHIRAQNRTNRFGTRCYPQIREESKAVIVREPAHHERFGFVWHIRS